MLTNSEICFSSEAAYDFKPLSLLSDKNHYQNVVNGVFFKYREIIYRNINNKKTIGMNIFFGADKLTSLVNIMSDLDKL